MEFLADLTGPASAPLVNTSSTEALFFYMFAGAVAFLLMNTVAVLTIVSFAKRKPSIEEQFATKEEMKEGFGRVDEEIARLNARNEALAQQIFAEIKAGNVSMNHEFSSLNRSIGKLEGHQALAQSIAEAIKTR